MSLISLARWAMRFFSWITPHIERYLNEYNLNAREAERNFQQRNYREAANYYAASLKDANRRHKSTLKKTRIVVRIAECLRRCRDFDGALTHGEEALLLAHKVGERHAIYGVALEVLSMVKEDRGDAEGALELARQALACALTSKDQSTCAERAGRLADLERKAGNTDASRRLREESIEYFTSAHGERHPGTATQLAAMAMVLQEEGQLDDALPLFQKAHTVHRQTLGVNARETLLDLEHMGQIHYLQGNLEEALSSYAKLAHLKETEIGSEATEHSRFLIDAATVHEVAGETAKALEFLIQARQKAGRDATLGSIIGERLARLQAA